MELVKTDGYLLKIIPYGDYDGIAHVFTKDYGKLSCFLRSYKRSKKRFMGSIDRYLFNQFEIQFKPNRDIHILKSAKIIEPYLNLRKKSVNLIMAQYLTELVISVFKDMDQEIFDFYHNSIQFLDQKEIDNYHYQFFKFTTLYFAGYLPDPVCSFCYKEIQNDGYFSLENNLFYCEQHKTFNSSIFCSPEIIIFLQSVMEQRGVERVFSTTEREILSYIFNSIYKNISKKPILTDKILKEFL